MKERPILFSGPMVPPVLDDTKTNTRRVVRALPDLGEPEQWCHMLDKVNNIVGDYRRYCPYGIPGDRLWVREAWNVGVRVMDGRHATQGMRILDRIPKHKPEECRVLFKADYTGDGWGQAKWRPSIHMPRWASRILLEVVAVRVERLQEIDNQGALAEGAPDVRTVENNWDMRDCFRALWDGLNEKRGFGWAVNPWVWVVEFRRIGHG
jgi:hypothetical protein